MLSLRAPVARPAPGELAGAEDSGDRFRLHPTLSGARRWTQSRLEVADVSFC